jgi:hypothetical protein
MKHPIQISKRNEGKFGPAITWNHKASSMDWIGVSVELLRKKAFLYIYIYIYIYSFLEHSILKSKMVCIEQYTYIRSM